MAATLSMISTISFVVSGTSFALAVFLWFKFKIPSVYGDLSGRTAQKSIAQMRANNEKSGAKGFRPSAVNAQRGKLTETMASTEKNVKNNSVADNGRPETGLLAENQAKRLSTDQTELLYVDDETSILIEEDETVPLQEPSVRKVKRYGGKKLLMLDEVIYVHTNEVIDLSQFEGK